MTKSNRHTTSVVKTVLVATLLALAIIPAGVASAATATAEIAGLRFPDSVQVADAKVPLVGVGLRTKFFVKVYAAALHFGGTAKEAIAADAPKSLTMRFLHTEVEAGKLQNAWREGFDGNTPSPSPELKKKMDVFVALFADSARKGDEYRLEYQPATGTKIFVKGKEAAVIAGADFMRALFAIWLGEKPADKDLKKGLLGTAP